MFVRWIISVLLSAVALIATAQLLDGFILESFGWAIIASIVLGVLNAIVRPILVILTLPITVVSLGLFLFVINAITLWITQLLIDDAFVIEDFGTALIAAIILSILNLILNKLTKDVK
ncbi:putative membrane protein YvlD [Lentibacillus sp. JNUCC-1]|uniref:phage holin family protein n=1 Tax=Lentibacillus sp. JNUCC-1 TaxID=2654513 RepID=UPI0012E6F3AB|nr:phage holin family protein [Lentibacillus sp. JNUCC-1]MUV39083.1 putative membrane protein YvlD [Lentibacillus sp. JNUCC-1]